MDVLRKAPPELVSAVEDGRIAISAASKMLVLPQNEQANIATADNPRQAAREALRELRTKRCSDIEPTRLFEELTSGFEQTPTVEMQELVLQFCDERNGFI